MLKQHLQYLSAVLANRAEGNLLEFSANSSLLIIATGFVDLKLLMTL